MSVSLTIDEAVALMVNMDFIPEGETVLSMTEAFFEEASVEFENAYGADKYQLKIFENRMRACEARHNLAALLRASLIEDAIYTEDTVIECPDESTDENPLITLDSLSNWAFDRFGIAVPTKGYAHEVSVLKNNPKTPTWKDVVIKIYADFKLGYSINGSNFKRKSFMDLDMMGKSKNEPNKIGYILIALSKKIKYPQEKQPSGATKKAMTTLRRSLEKIIKLPGDPIPYVESIGYKPIFKLIDETKNADERARRGTKHVHVDDVNESELLYGMEYMKESQSSYKVDDGNENDYSYKHSEEFDTYDDAAKIIAEND